MKCDDFVKMWLDYIYIFFFRRSERKLSNNFVRCFSSPASFQRIIRENCRRFYKNDGSIMYFLFSSVAIEKVIIILGGSEEINSMEFFLFYFYINFCFVVSQYIYIFSTYALFTESREVPFAARIKLMTREERSFSIFTCSAATGMQTNRGSFNISSVFFPRDAFSSLCIRFRESWGKRTINKSVFARLIRLVTFLSTCLPPFAINI